MKEITEMIDTIRKELSSNPAIKSFSLDLTWDVINDEVVKPNISLKVKMKK